MHLPASTDCLDALCRLRKLRNNLANHLGRSSPPISRALFGPPVVLHDLIVFMTNQFLNLPGCIHECRTYAARTDIDRQKKCVLVHIHPPIRAELGPKANRSSCAGLTLLILSQNVVFLQCFHNRHDSYTFRFEPLNQGICTDIVNFTNIIPKIRR